MGNDFKWFMIAIIGVAMAVSIGSSIDSICNAYVKTHVQGVKSGE